MSFILTISTPSPLTLAEAQRKASHTGHTVASVDGRKVNLRLADEPDEEHQQYLAQDFGGKALDCYEE